MVSGGLRRNDENSHMRVRKRNKEIYRTKEINSLIVEHQLKGIEVCGLGFKVKLDGTFKTVGVIW